MSLPRTWTASHCCSFANVLGLSSPDEPHQIHVRDLRPKGLNGGPAVRCFGGHGCGVVGVRGSVRELLSHGSIVTSRERGRRKHPAQSGRVSGDGPGTTLDAVEG